MKIVVLLVEMPYFFYFIRRNDENASVLLPFFLFIYYDASNERMNERLDRIEKRDGYMSWNGKIFLKAYLIGRPFTSVACCYY